MRGQGSYIWAVIFYERKRTLGDILMTVCFHLFLRHGYLVDLVAKEGKRAFSSGPKASLKNHYFLHFFHVHFCGEMLS